MSNRIFSYLQVSTNGSFIFDSSETNDENEYTRVVNPFLSVNDPSTGSMFTRIMDLIMIYSHM